MNAEHRPDDRHPNPALFPGAEETPSPQFHYERTSGSVTTYTYFFEEQPSRFEFVHDKARGLCNLTKADGALEHFRDKPTRYLVVELDSNTGELMPTVKGGQPVYLYLCREEREV